MQSPGLAQEPLPFLGVGRHDLRHAVVSVLAEKWPLKAKQVFKLVEKDRADISYQGVHKALKQLVEEGAVSETVEGYELSMRWVQGLREALTRVSSKYSGAGRLRIENMSGNAKFSSRLFSLLENMISKKQIVWEPGTIFLFGNRVHLFPSAFMVHLAKSLHEEGRDWMQYRAARKLGIEWMSTALKSLDAPATINEATAHGSDILSFAGWISFDISHIETNPPKITLTGENSSFAREYLKQYGKTDFPVDHFLRGCFSGGYVTVFQEPSLEFVETKCLAKGDRYCEFVGMPRKMFNLKDKNVARQIGSDADVRRMESELAKS
ncbi:MAG: hypothetical protein Q7T16_06655 [Candidatus Burarchaeum sp.]|nr:hypothetical protein [Candidatus Burarchaeum sp.]MDO8340308.1 hypothetical protein [Candidatus Burarchaeum sp.]